MHQKPSAPFTSGAVSSDFQSKLSSTFSRLSVPAPEIILRTEQKIWEASSVTSLQDCKTSQNKRSCCHVWSCWGCCPSNIQSEVYVKHDCMLQHLPAVLCIYHPSPLSCLTNQALPWLPHDLERPPHIYSIFSTPPLHPFSISALSPYLVCKANTKQALPWLPHEMEHPFTGTASSFSASKIKPTLPLFPLPTALPHLHL